jgi:hypothetical protein
MVSALANWKRLKWIKPDESLSARGRSPKLGFGAEQRVNQGIAINPEPPMRHNDPRAAYAARTVQIHAKLARLQQLADDHFGHDPDAVHWGHVGDLGRVEQALDDLLAIFDGRSE